MKILRQFSAFASPRRSQRARLAIWLTILFLGMSPQLGIAAEQRVSLVLICDIYKAFEENGRGGLARVAAIVKAEKARSPNVLVAHAGDAISPSMISSFDQGAHMIQLLNGLPIDVFVPGNHEFDFGSEVFLQRMREARFPLYAANLRQADGSQLPGFIDGRIHRFGDVQIGVIGLTSEDSTIKSKPAPLRIAPMLETARTTAAQMRAEGADLIVLVSHSNREIDDALLASGIAEIILSGDDHDVLVHHTGKTAIVEAGIDGNVVAVIDLTISIDDRGGRRRVTWHPRFRILDTADVVPDPEITTEVAGIMAKVSAQIDEPIGQTSIDLDSRNAAVRGGEAAIGNLFADALRESTGADVALINGGSFRGNRVVSAGSIITRRDILTELPFSDNAIVLELSGATLQAALETALSGAENAVGRFPQISGMILQADLTRPNGSRVVSLQINGRPIDPAHQYRVATNSFISNGGDGYEPLSQARILLAAKDSDLIVDLVIDYIRQKKTISSAPDGRIIVKR